MPMTKDEIIDYTRGSSIKAGFTPSEVITRISSKVPVGLLMDHETLDYYYAVRIDDMAESSVDTEDLDMLMKNGFGLDSKRSMLVNYIID